MDHLHFMIKAKSRTIFLKITFKNKKTKKTLHTWTNVQYDFYVCKLYGMFLLQHCLHVSTFYKQCLLWFILHISHISFPFSCPYFIFLHLVIWQCWGPYDTFQLKSYSLPISHIYSPFSLVFLLTLTRHCQSPTPLPSSVVSDAGVY